MGDAAGDMVIVAYQPRPGCEEALLALTRAHVPFLRERGLATHRPTLAMRGADGTIVEVFEWADGAIARAHAESGGTGIVGPVLRRLRGGAPRHAARSGDDVRDVRAAGPAVMIGRRALLAGSAALLVAGRLDARGGNDVRAALAAIERASGGRLGVAALDSGSGQRVAWRGDERFPLCSTFKLLLVAAILRRVDRARELLGRALPVTARDIVPVSPVTGQHVGQSMTVAELCRATMIFSDNAAANLLLPLIGGPPGIGAFARTLGDRATRLDRMETDLGECTPGDPRDTTTPAAILGDIQRILLGHVLAPASRALLLGWLAENRTGAGKLVAGLPSGWRIGDKTGGGEYGTTNDLAIVWPPSRAPILIASYLTQTDAPIDVRNAVHANVARALMVALVA